MEKAELSADRVLTITYIGHQVHDWASLELSSLCGKIQSRSRSPEKSLQLILKDEREQNNDLTGGKIYFLLGVITKRT